MCVIFAVTKERPTEEMVEKAWDRNDDGGGVAWREPAEDGHGMEVVWEKGINSVEEMKELAKRLPLPYVMHFRIASSGGIRPSLTHPFPIDREVPTWLTGRTKGSVLFHNGTWRSWEEEARRAAIFANAKIPSGKFSDARAMAWLCSIYGHGFMEFLPDQKGVILGPDKGDLDIYTGTGNFPLINGVWCSNDFFMSVSHTAGYSSPTPYKRTFCKYPGCTRKDIDFEDWCPKHKSGVIQTGVEHSGTGGSQTVIPFPQIPKGQIIGLELAKLLTESKDHNGQRLLAKNKYKKIKKLYEVLGARKWGKRQEEAMQELDEMTEELNSRMRPTLH